MRIYTPPFSITSKILELSQKISRQIGLLEGQKLSVPLNHLRRTNQIKTIQASLAIEGNTLSLDQVTAIVAGKRILGPKNEILEVQNAAQVYAHLAKLNPLAQSDLLKAHKLLMHKLVQEAGDYRSKGVGIFQGKKLAHMAPPAKQVPRLMNDLFGFTTKNQEISWLLKSCIFHYEFEFIHPFEDGNGRMGRLWQQLLLMKEHSIFEYLSIEEIIKNRQKDYYDALAESDKTSQSTAFIEFSLESILEAISVYSSNKIEPPKDAHSRLAFSQKPLRSTWFSRQDYHQYHPDISTATASRDLAMGVRQHILKAQGAKNQRLYQFRRAEF